MKPRIPSSRKNIKSLQNARQQSASGVAGEGDGSLGGGGGHGSAGSGGGAYSVAAAAASELHKPIPMIVHDGPILFEAFIFFYCILALLLQYLHLYKSVWWLPHSYNSYTMNFYLIDQQLIAFCALVLVRRLIWSLVKRFILAISPTSWAKSFVIVARSLNTFAILIGLLYLSYHIVQNHPLVNMLYLTYPVTLYFLLFGLSGEQFLELTPASPNGKIKIVSDKSGFYHTTGPSSAPFLQLINPTSSGSGSPAPGSPSSGANANNSSTTITTSSIQPELIRQEVAVLKADFNARLKQILFNTIVSAYYGAVIPCLFAQSTLYYDLAWVGRHALLVGVGAFVIYVVYCFPSSYVLMMNRTATLLGQWIKVEGRPVVNNLYAPWHSSMMCPANTTVKHQNKLFRAEGATNCAEPGNSSHSRFYTLFKEPSLILGVLLIVQSGLVMAQHISLTWSSHWYQLLSEALMLFSNYYALFKVLRDYIVFWRFYCSDPEGTTDS